MVTLVSPKRCGAPGIRSGRRFPGALLQSRPGVGHGDENVTRLPQFFRSVDTPGGTRTRSFRIESPASFLFDHRGVPKTDIAWERSPPMPALPASATHGRNRNDFTDRSHHGSAKPSRTSIGYSDGRDRTCASRLTVACLTARPHRNVRRKERESNPQGRGPPVFETGYHARWQSFQQVTPAGLEPARPRLRVGRSTELSYGARDVVGRARTCNAPRFRRALYLL